MANKRVSESKWAEAQERYRLGATFAQLADFLDVTDRAVSKRAKKNGWTRDLAKAKRDKVKSICAIKNIEISKTGASKNDDLLDEAALVDSKILTKSAATSGMMIQSGFRRTRDICQRLEETTDPVESKLLLQELNDISLLTTRATKNFKDARFLEDDKGLPETQDDWLVSMEDD